MATQATSSLPQKPISGDILPWHILVEMLSYLKPTEAWNAAQVCRWWPQLLKGDWRLNEQVQRNGDKEPASVLAARYGQLELLKWGVEQAGWKLEARLCTAAAEGGHVEVLEWLRANGCPWDDYVCGHAAQAGQLGVLQWLRANDYPWDRFTFSSAAEAG